MKKITGLDERMLTITAEEDGSKMLTRRQIFQLMGNQKADTADNARRVRRILSKLRDNTLVDLVLESDDMAFLAKFFETNPPGLPAWMQGQILDVLDSADKVEPAKV